MIDRLANGIRGLVSDFNRFKAWISYAALGGMLQALTLPLIILPFLAHHLSRDEFGQLAVILALANYVIVVIGGNLPLVIFSRHKDLEPDARSRFFGKMHWLSLIVSGLITLIFIVYYSEISSLANLNFGFREAVPILIFMGLLSHSGALVAFVSSDLLFKNLFVAQLLFFLGSFAVLGGYYFLPDIAWSIGFVVGPLVLVAYLTLFIGLRMKTSFKAFPGIRFVREVGSELAVWVAAAAIINILLFGDRWLLAAFGVGFDQIGAYAVAVQANMLLIFVARQLSVILVPIISNLETIEQIGRPTIRKINLLILFSILGVLIGGGVLGPIFIKIFYGAQYWQDSKFLFYIILIGTSLFPLQIFSRGFLIRFHKPVRTLQINMLGLLAMIATIAIAGRDIDITVFGLARTFGIAVVSLSAYFVVFPPLLAKNRLSSEDDH